MIKLRWKAIQTSKKGRKKVEREVKHEVCFVDLERAQNFAKTAEKLGGFDFVYSEISFREVTRQ